MKFKKILKDNKWSFITFFVALMIISLIYTIKSIKPFGVNSMLDVDFYHQYGPLLNEFRNRVSENRSLLFSFNTGGGIPFYRNFMNYLSSPFNIILFLFNKKDVVMSFSIIIRNEFPLICLIYIKGYGNKVRGFTPKAVVPFIFLI